MYQVMKDPEQGHLLERDGFVKVRLTAPLASPDELTRAAAELCDAHEAYRCVPVAAPSGDTIEYRQGWTHVDEPAARSFTVWAALDDVDGADGQLCVLRSSHRLAGPHRGPGLNDPWLRHDRAIRARLLTVPLRSGEAVVVDDRLVIGQHPDRTGTAPRVVAIGLRPSGAALVMDRAGAGGAERVELSDDAYQGVGLWEEPTEHGPVVPLVSTGRDLSSLQLAQELDRGIPARADQARRVVRHGSDSARRTVALSRRMIRRGMHTGAAVPERLGQLRVDLPAKGAMATLATNEAVIDRFGPDTPAIWDPTQFEWHDRVEAAYDDVRAEVEALLAGPTEIPHIEDVTGGIPQGNEGPWRSFLLMHQGHWIDWNCQRCPRTTELVRSIPELTLAGFSMLEPGTHITEHRGPNKGALRYQLGVIVPGRDGDCRIRVGDEMIRWHEGEGVMFDFTVPHEAWNDSDSPRILLMLEVLTPLPWYLDRPNRVAQRAMGWFPTTRNVKQRLQQLEPTLQRAASS